MGEAWFMGERHMFNELAGALDSLSVEQLQRPLAEIASGTASFGAMDEWQDWYHYLLPQLLPRSHECFVAPLLESLVTGFMVMYPNGVRNPRYKNFESDVLQTLGRCMMEANCWNGSEVVLGAFLHRSNKNPNQIWRWWDASGDFSASMFFCLKYLPTASLREWIASVFAIPSPYWRAQVLVWLVGAHSILEDQIKWPAAFDVNARPYIGWEWSHCLDDNLGPSLLSLEARHIMLNETREHFKPDVFGGCLKSINAVPTLESELAEIPLVFEQLYVARHA